MLQGNNSYRLVADKDYRPGSLDSSNGPTSLEGPITLVYVAPGAAVLDFYDAKNNRSTIEIGPNNSCKNKRQIMTLIKLYSIN